MVLVGALVAPIVWASRGDRTPVTVQDTGGAAAIVEFDAATDTQPADSMAIDPIAGVTTTVEIIQAQTITVPPTTAAPT
ncbi:MAG: hypothetical protein EBY07_03850, partial [Actinobacteria bacterium]|nr:hypothetical protein [Actinomycetota bacterium]